MNPQYRRGDQVRLISRRDQIGAIISEPRFQGGEYWYRVLFGQNGSMFPERDLEAFTDASDPLTLIRAGVYSTKESFSKLMTYYKLKTPLDNTIYAYQAARIELLPYQYKPLLKFLASDNQRLLIADEVGLGKTIEAGLILSELRQRSTLRRVLIVCKANLTHKWRMEMRAKFQEEFRIVRAAEIRELITDVVEHDPLKGFRGICSLESLRSERLMMEIKDARLEFDLVILDEAQHLRNPETNSNKLARLLNELSQSMILLTATPVQIGNQDLFHLLEILDPKEFSSPVVFERRVQGNSPIVQAERLVRTRNQANMHRAKELLLQYKVNHRDLHFTESAILNRTISRLEETGNRNAEAIVAIQHDLSRLNSFAHILTRTRKREVIQHAPERQARTIRFDWSPVEARIYRLVTEYVIRRQRTSTGAFAMFATMMPQRQVASCIRAMLEYYRDRINWSESSVDFDSDDFGGEVDEETADTMMRQLQDDFYKEIKHWLGEPIPDTKFDKLLHQILHGLDKEQPGEKIIIFSYFKKTLEYLSQRLRQEGYSNTIISGDYDDERRRERIEQFRHPDGPRILLSSEVGAEGLDMQFCHIMVNYDLPWNPMAVEQRIGRLDRHGQKAERILIFNFSINGTIEQKILDRLYERIGIFQASIGDLEPILGEQIKTLQRDLLRSYLTAEELEKRIEEEALILERERLLLLELEKESAKFVGQGEYFDEEIRRIKERRRYLSPEELSTFVQEFLLGYLSRNPLKRLSEVGQFELASSSRLEEFFDKYVIAQYRDQAFLRFSSLLQKGTVRFSFDAEQAYRHRDLEFMSWSHPFIRAIARYYDENERELVPVAKLEMSTDTAPAGDYVYVVYYWEITGASTIRRTEVIFAPLHGAEPLDEAISEKLLATLISDAGTLPGRVEMSQPALEELLSRTEKHFLRRLFNHKTEVQETNNAVLDIRLKSLEDMWRNTRQLLEQRLREARGSGALAKVISGKETRLRNLELDYEKRAEEIAQRRKVGESFKEIAAGFLRII